MNMRTAPGLVMVCLALVWAGIGCDKADPDALSGQLPPSEARISATPEYTPFTNTQQILAREDILSTNNMDIVEVDFNNDGQLDLVVSDKPVPVPKDEKPPLVSPKVSIFIQQSVGQYYLGAIIREAIRGQVVGLAHKEGEQNQDLFVFYRYENGSTEMVRYLNNGQGFTRIKDGVSVKTTPSGTGKP